MQFSLLEQFALAQYVIRQFSFSVGDETHYERIDTYPIAFI